MAEFCNCPVCLDARARHLRRPHVEGRDAKEKAESLLLPMLIPEQRRGWAKHRAFSVRGSKGRLWRIDAGRIFRHTSMVREDGIGTAVWPMLNGSYEGGSIVQGDFAIAMLLYLKDDEQRVYQSGCHEYVFHPPFVEGSGRELFVPTDYGGKL